jgi:hypothetical protein
MLDIDNSSGQTDDAFKRGQYAIVNLIYYPTANALVGLEYQWADRENFRDDFNPTGSKIQISFKYNFSQKFYHEPTPTE